MTVSLIIEDRLGRNSFKGCDSGDTLTFSGAEGAELRELRGRVLNSNLSEDGTVLLGNGSGDFGMRI